MQGALLLHPKVTASTLAGALGIVTAWAFDLADIVVPTPVTAALVLLLTFAGGWLAPVLKRELRPKP